MTTSCMRAIRRKLLFLLLTVLSVPLLKAQITVTSPVPLSVTTYSATLPGAVVFGVKNTNAASITITDIGNYVPAGFSGTLTLWYHTGAVTNNPPAINTTNGWVQAGQQAVSATTAGIAPIFSGLNISIAANTTYRFAISGPANSPSYGGPGSTGNLFQGGGLEIYVQDNANSPGFGGAFPGPPTATQASFVGSITFSPTVACTTPPDAGTAVASSSFVCEGNSFSLNLSDASIGTGQTYQWQSSPDNTTWTNIGSASNSSGYVTTQAATTYYRAAVTCGGNTAYSTSVRVVRSTKVSGTFTINKALPTGGANFRNFTDAINSIKACGIDGPVVFNVAQGSGPYTEQITIPAILGASNINTITFNGNGATLQTFPDNNNRQIIRLDGADYITINNLKILAQTGAGYGWGVHLMNGADYNTITNCDIDISAVVSSSSGNSGGIVVSGSTISIGTDGSASNNTISNNKITGAYEGIYINGTTGSLNAVNNIITNNTIKDFHEKGIELKNTDGTLVSFNNISRAGRAEIGLFTGIELGTGNKRCVVNTNRIHDTHNSATSQNFAAYGIYSNSCDATAGSENKITNNVLYNFNSASGTIYGLYNTGSDYVQYYHNTVVLDNAGATNGQTVGFYQSVVATGIQFKNNIIYITRNGAGAKNCLYFGTTSTAIASNKNVLYMNSPAGTNGIGFWVLNKPTLADWKATNSSIYDQQSVSADPLFVNAPAGDFTPTEAAVNNLGDYMGISKDITDKSRSLTTPDAGAFEFDVVLCSGTPTPGITATTVSSVCTNTIPFTLSANGASAGTGITYQWQSSTDNVTWTNIPSATNYRYNSSGINTTTYFRRATVCSGVSAYSTPVVVTFAIPEYAPLPYSESFEVKWSDVCNTREVPNNFWRNNPATGNNAWRRNDDGLSAAWSNLTGGAYTPTASLGNYSARFHSANTNNGIRGKIDLYINANTAVSRKMLQFDYINVSGKDSMVVYLSTDNGSNFTRLDSVNTTPIWKTKTITFSATSATAILRFEAISEFGSGDIGLDNIQVADFPDCSAAPAGGTAISSTTTACVDPFTLSVTGATVASGITYQWQSSTDNTTWTNINGANATNLTTTQLGTTYYRMVVTCSNGGGSAISTSVQVISPVLVSGTFTINKAQPTGGTNFQSFNDAYNHIKCGINGSIVFNVVAGSGPYNEQLILQQIPGTSATSTITFNGNGATLSYLSTNTDERAVIKLNGTDYVTFNNLVVTAEGSTTGEFGFGVQLLNDADNNTIKNCTININQSSSSTDFAGIVMSYAANSATSTGTTKCDNNTFSGNTITGGYYGITLVGTTADLIVGAVVNNQILNNTIQEFYNYGIYVSASLNTRIEGNTITRPSRAAVTDFNGIFFTGLSTRAKITRNTITNPFGGAPKSTNSFNGINFSSVNPTSTFENIISNNRIYNLTGSGNAIAITNNASNSTWYYHNTISMDGAATASTSSHLTIGFYQGTKADGLELKNNIITISRGGPSAKTAIYFNNNTATFVSDRNDFFISSITGTNNIGFWNTARLSLANWRSATGQDANSVSSNPVYTDLANGNLKPQNASIDNRGATVGIINDFDGVTRSASTPDLGAYEFTPAGCVTPPVAGTVAVSETPVCSESPVMLTATGNSFGAGQTFQWQSSTSAAGTYINFGPVLSNPDTVFSAPSINLYYRLAATCSAQTSYSAPVLLTVTQPLLGGTYTINSGAAASYVPGVVGGNFQSFNAAKAAMSCGISGPVVINVESGTGPYNEQLILDSIRGTSELNTITFNGNGNAINFSSSNSAERAVIKLNGTDYITFDSLTVDATGTGTYGYGIQFINNADFNTIRNCTINLDKTSTSSSFAGIVISASATSPTGSGATLCDDNIIDNNKINGGYYGITVVGNTGNYINNNRVVNNKVNDFYSYGIYVSGTYNTLVEGNELTRPNRTNATTTYAINASNMSEGLRISKNRIHNLYDAMTSNTNPFYGIYFSAADATTDHVNTVSNNLVYNINGEGTVVGLYNDGSNNALYYHNTVSLDNTASTSNSLTYGFYQSTDAEGIEVKNNIITIMRSSTGNRFALYFNTATTRFTSDYNNFYLAPVVNKSFVGFLSANQATLSNWKSASGKDLNSSVIDPVYENPATGNFKPTSPNFDNRGTGVGITTDIVDIARHNSAPDMGAYEFTVPACTTPTTGGTATASPSSSVCMGTPVMLSLTGNTFGSGISFQWEYATSASGTYQPLGNAKLFPDTLIEASTTLYYRAAVSCSGNTAYSTPVPVMITPSSMKDDYTIDPAAPAGTPKNYSTFAAAVAALECGIAGPVTFKVAPGTYTEQVRMHKIAGASADKRVTFQSADGNAASVVLQYNASATKNYVLQLDSASYVTYKDMTITALNSSNGRAIELANTASYDSLVNLVINVPTTGASTLSIAGIYANMLKGGSHVIKGNTISNGASGIYLRGISTSVLTPLNVIEGNTINGSSNYGIYAYYTNRIKISNNTVNITAPINGTSGVFAGYCDTAYQVVGNKVTINNVAATATVKGIYVNYSNSTEQELGKVAGNTILITNNNLGDVYGLYNDLSSYNNTVNNVVSINTSGSRAYALYSNQCGNVNYYNNTIYSSATASANNIAGYFYHHNNNSTTIRNNIFAHNGGGKAFYSYNPSYTFSDYNMLYTNGSLLIHVGNTDATYTSLQAWRDAYAWDVNSIVYKPAFLSETDLQPNVADPEVWAMHGRGVQITGNDYDFNNNPRPTTLTAGVPDLGAYEFVPTATPPVLTAIPATPIAGGTQTFMMGTDTVSKITWGANVPTSINMRRYSGVIPTGLTPATPHMYYYTEVETTGTAAGFTKKDFFIDPWQGWINHQYQTRLGRTDAVGSWMVGVNSAVDTAAKVITEDALSDMFRFTGIADLNVARPLPPSVTQQIDSSNWGKRFWVAYADSYDFPVNTQDMVLYLSTGDEPATVTVKVNGTNWVRTYTIPANTVITSDKMPKAGSYDSRLLVEGMSNRGISIESDVPIVAYAHIYYQQNSGATMLLPVGTYGYEYYTLNARQDYNATNSHSSFFVVADRDNTTVEITPSNPTHGGRAANVPFTVTLNRGEVYQVLGAYMNTTEGYDLTGSKVVSIPNADGKCFPIAVFAGSSRTRLGCGLSTGNGGDLLIQQVFPSQAWGTRYLTAPTSIAATASNFQTNIYRVMVKDAATEVKVNGTVLTDLIANRYYQFESNTADYIQSNKPVMVAQYMASSNSNCMGSSSTSDGDPELFYLSPIEQAVKKAGFYRNNKYAINVNYLTLTIPTGGLASLTIDGSKAFDHVYAHPSLPGYSVVVKSWGPFAGQSWVQSDSAFTGIVYGEGNAESYGYNVGTLVKNLNALSSITNTFNTTGSINDFTCTNAPFKISILVPVKPTTLTWSFSQATGLSPNNDVTLVSPVAVDSVVINNKKYYKFVLSQDYVFNKTGSYTIPISYSSPEIEGCSHTLENVLNVKVVQAPTADFAVNFTNCIGDVAKFSGSGGAGVNVAQWNWNMGDGSAAATQNPTRQYAAPGSYNVNMKLTTADGCLGDTTKKVPVNARPIVNVVKDSLSACRATNVTFAVKDPLADITYNWYNAGGTLAGTGSSFTATVNANTNYFVEAVSNGCASTIRTKVTAVLLADLSTPLVVVDSASVNSVRFKWNAVASATSYEVSSDGGATWSAPSNGLTHTITGLLPLQPAKLIVRAKGGCQDVQSLTVTGKALVDQVYIPNSFSPNGDGLNDVLQVYGYVVKDVQFMVYNQWGEKIYESKDQKRAWDGTHKGKLQPSGVYLYVCRLILNDGSVMNKKGSINLVR